MVLAVNLATLVTRNQCAQFVIPNRHSLPRHPVRGAAARLRDGALLTLDPYHAR